MSKQIQPWQERIATMNMPLEMGKVSQPAPKIEENNRYAWAYNYESAWHQVFDTCQNLGMKHISECTNEEDVCAFIRTLAQRAGEMEQRFGFTYCAYCGKSFMCDAPDVTDSVSKHVATCSKHPMRAVEKERDEWKQRAGEGYTTQEIARYCRFWNTGSAAANNVDNPQDGIKAVTTRADTRPDQKD
jgi:transcription elongation factor Elf1